ncbi:MAG: endonuclease/exonuclease/phosphatase family protein [Acidimicrobiales bacterium]|nr:endonuclease/exonuclease/phosphatase family protein [Hyphomonadaceae bacterium]RZV41621.1 MAG: endonuclease/exonuclease/phosphatase family protein [Acidimicrobiales bacterium]
MKNFIKFIILLALNACAHEAGELSSSSSDPISAQESVRIATFNVSMYRQAKADLISALFDSNDDQILAVAEIINTVDPDILLINEFDYDKHGKSLNLFQTNYLKNRFGYSYVAPSNTGVSSGFDLNNDGAIVTEPGAFGYAGDAFGFGDFEGQYGFAIVSKFPIDTDNVRTFQNFLWKDMPDNLIPIEWYSHEERNVLRLSSKNHVDAPIRIGDKTVHIIAAHPTPPTFDGPEDRNGKRNHDEIRLIADYITPEIGGYLVDDNGKDGGLAKHAQFVIMGDMNADPNDGDSYNHAIRQLLSHERIAKVSPQSSGAVAAAKIAAGANTEHISPHANDTADFRDINDDGTNAVGNLRLDYVLPSNNLNVVASGVFWPADGEDGYNLVGPGYPPVSSDHRLVWIDVKID